MASTHLAMSVCVGLSLVVPNVCNLVEMLYQSNRWLRKEEKGQVGVCCVIMYHFKFCLPMVEYWTSLCQFFPNQQWTSVEEFIAQAINSLFKQWRSQGRAQGAFPPFFLKDDRVTSESCFSSLLKIIERLTIKLFLS